MTWQAYARVENVTDSLATLVARETDLVQPWKDTKATFVGVTSNTEGRIKAVSIQFEFDGPSPLKEGDIVSASGHFRSATED